MKKSFLPLTFPLLAFSYCTAAAIDNPEHWRCYPKAGSTQWACEDPNPNPKQKLAPASLAQHLGWVSSPSTKGYCKGYYEASLFSPRGKKPSENLSITGNEWTIPQKGITRISGKILAQKENQQLNADLAFLQKDAANKQYRLLDSYGNVSYQQPGLVLFGQHGRMNLDNDTISMQDAAYRFSLDAKDRTRSKWYGTTVRGQAKTIEQLAPGRFQFTKASYSTCPPTDNAWELHASKIVLDRKSGRGNARNLRVEIAELPLFYSPYFSFPIDDRRYSGFLYPSISFDNASGTDLRLPYYWNLAPNYDLTTTPRLISRRGVLLENSFRFLTYRSQGNLDFNIIPNDTAFSQFRRTGATDFPSAPSYAKLKLEDFSNRRTYLSLHDDTRFNAHWSANLDFNEVSDDYYFRDFGNIDQENNTTNNQLLRRADLRFRSAYWHGFLRGQSYQTLHPITSNTVLDQYSRLPQLQLEGKSQPLGAGFHSELFTDINRFTHDQAPETHAAIVAGDRINLRPSVHWGYQPAAGFIKPKFALDVTDYQLKDQSATTPAHLTRTVPILSLDSGAYFDRSIQMFGGHYQQSLEPRAFYLYVPFRDQNDIPDFDTSVATFNYDQLFRDNRFNGIDRIGDANQLSLALESHLVDSISGEEILEMGVGEILYFRDRQTSLKSCNDNNCRSSENPRWQETTSPIAAQMKYHLDTRWDSSAQAAWDPHDNALIEANANLSYQRDSKHLLNLGYTFTQGKKTLDPATGDFVEDDRGVRKLVNGSFYWSLSSQWQALAHLNYDLKHNHTQAYFFGLEYDTCCWRVRLLRSRVANSVNADDPNGYKRTIYLQWELKGLGAIGTKNANSLIQQNIRGYHNNFGRALP